MITVHHLENSRSIRVIWLLEELGLEYELKTYSRDPVTNLAPDAYKQLHKLGKAPIITDGDLVLAETGAIVEYIIDTYAKGKMRPKVGTKARIDYNYWLHAAEGSLMPLIVMDLFLGRMETMPPFFMKPFVKPVTGQVRKGYHTPTKTDLFEYINSELDGRTWFAGDKLTAADIMMSFPMEAAAARSGLDTRYPNALAYIKRLHERPAYQEALRKGGALEILGTKT